MDVQGYLRTNISQAVFSPAPQLLALFASRWLHDTKLMTWTAGSVAVASLLAWIATYRRFNVAAYTASSNVASAAQGYVELSGNAEAHASAPTFSKLRGLPCLWFKYCTEEKSDDQWKVIDRGESDSTFLLRDHTGVCIVDPEGAEIHTAHKEIWTSGDMRHTEWLLLARDPLYILGNFTTINSADTALNARQDTSDLLAEWKRNRPQLLARFDLNKDGEISEEEWRLARAQAQREVAKRHREIRVQPGFHLIHAPRDGRPFLITNRDPEKLLRSYRFWGLFHVAVFVGAFVWWGYLLQR